MVKGKMDFTTLIHIGRLVILSHKLLLPPTIPQKLIKYGYNTNGYGKTLPPFSPFLGKILDNLSSIPPIFYFLLEKPHDGVLQVHKSHNENHGI